MSILSFFFAPLRLPAKALMWPFQCVNFIIRLAFYGLLLATVLNLLGRFHWTLDMLSQFRLQMTLVLFAFSVVFAATLQFKKAVIGLCFVALNSISLWPYSPLGVKAQPPTQGPTLTLLHANLWFQSFSLHKVTALIERTNPDVISFSEYDYDWYNGLRESHVLEKYPYAIYNDDVAIYSRLPMTGGKLIETGEKMTAVASVTFDGATYCVISSHPWSPTNRANYWKNRREMAALADVILKQRKPCIVAGDLNATPWSVAYHDLMQATQLTDTQRYSGLQPSWPTFVIIPWFAIDHVLIPHDLVAIERRVGPFIGSDHYPVVVKLRHRHPDP